MYLFKIYTKNTLKSTDALHAVWFDNNPLTHEDLEKYACQLHNANQYARICVYEWYGKQIREFTCKGDHAGHSRVKHAAIPKELSEDEIKVLKGLPNHEWIFLSLSEMKQAIAEDKVIRKVPSRRWLEAQDPDFFTIVKLKGEIVELPTCWASKEIEQIFFYAGVDDDTN